MVTFRVITNEALPWYTPSTRMSMVPAPVRAVCSVSCPGRTTVDPGASGGSGGGSGGSGGSGGGGGSGGAGAESKHAITTLSTAMSPV
eukprot:4451219-Prymnesium_polylepis.1